MIYEKIGIQLEMTLFNELYELCQGNIIEKILKDAAVEKEQNFLRSVLEGHSFKITEEIAPELYKICTGIKEKLKFNEAVDFFISNSPDINAAAYFKSADKDAHIIILNSGLLNIVSEDELKFIIGHEIGHLISGSKKLIQVVDFIFPINKELPIVLHHKLNLWGKLAELTADRFGFLAQQDLNVVSPVFFKLSSGLNIDKIKFNHEIYIKTAEKLIEGYKNNPLSYPSSHPMNPLRLIALKYFSQSETLEKINKNNFEFEDKELSDKINELIQIMTVLGNSEPDFHRLNFLTSAGLITASSDNEISQDEIESILNVIANFHIFPKVFLEQLYASQKVEEIYYSSIEALLKHNPAERFKMFQYMIGIAVSDRAFSQEELDFLYKTGEKDFGFAKSEIAQLIAETIRGNFIPKLYQI